jgi:hypothetical protein
MAISMEQIDEMRKRTNCSYQEAKELLEKNNEDLIEAIIEFENRHGSQSREDRKNRQKAYQNTNHGRKAKAMLHKGFVTRLVIEKDQNIILNLPLIILILAVLISMPIIWIWPVAFIILYFAGYKIRIKKGAGGEVDINDIVDDFVKEQKPADKAQANRQNEAVGNNVEVKKEDGYNEITVE